MNDNVEIFVNLTKNTLLNQILQYQIETLEKHVVLKSIITLTNETHIQNRFNHDLLSISSFLRNQNYEKITRKKIEQSINEKNVLNKKLSKISSNNETYNTKIDRQKIFFIDKNNNQSYLYFLNERYWSFQNETNYVLIFWFHQYKCTKRNMNRFFRNVKLKFFHRFAFYRNANE